MQQQKRFRLEIEGVRAIAALLVAVYHIWLNRVSGGVDVFFIMSGFLITTSLLSMYRRENGIFIFQYLVKLWKRLIPSSWFIALVTFGLSYFLVSPHTRPQFFNELIAALFYFENWRLATDAVDYLAQNNEASPYQHYWALSIQFQFYIIWLILFKISAWVIKKSKTISFQSFILIFLIVISTSSFIYSIYLTNVNQPVAYYHTFTRVWEFGLGGILALTIHRVTLPKAIAWLFGWIGLIGLLIGGLIFQVSTVFPGYAALWPTLSAVLILLAGNTSQKWSAYNILASKPLVSFGKISYAFYLWHWPILILFLNYFERGTVSLKAGLAIILLSIILAYITIYGIENPVRKIQSTVRKTATRLSILAVSVGALLTVYSFAVLPSAHLEFILTSDHPGASILLTDEDPFVYQENYIPQPDIGVMDNAIVYEDGCFQTDSKTDVISCEYGDTQTPVATIALVGGSHSVHWQPMLEQFGLEENVKIVTYLKGRCRFTLEDTSDHPECLDWFDDVIEQLLQDKPDLIFTIGDIGNYEGDVLPQGFVDAWRIFEKADIPLFLVRDNPWYYDSVQGCVRNAKDNANEECKLPRKDIVRNPSLLSTASYIPKNATIFDPTDFFCDDEFCYPIIGNVVTHSDNNHITASYSRTMTPLFKEPLLEALNISK